MIQDWTMKQWRLVWNMVQSNEWKLHRYEDTELDNQINVALQVYCDEDTASIYAKAFSAKRGRVRDPMHGTSSKKGAPNPFSWTIDGEQLDDFLDNLWIMISKKDPHGRSTDVRQAQDIRRRVREGNSYPFYDPRSPKGNRERLGLQWPRLLRNRRGP